MSMRVLMMLLFSILLTNGSASADDTETQQLQGRWVVTQLVEDGKVIPPDAIREWLPSGGRIVIEDNAILFQSPQDGKKHVKVFSIDATTYPKRINLSTRSRQDGWGIYRMDGGRLVVCLSDPEESPRPSEFAAPDGSQQVLMVLERASAKASSAPPAKKSQPKPQSRDVTAEPLTDAQVTDKLAGTWRYTDSVGALFITFDADGTFQTVREVKELRLFQKVFVRTPVSSGTWSVKHGKLAFVVNTSTSPDRVGRELDFAVRSLSDKDLIFVDYLGRVGQAARVR